MTLRRSDRGALLAALALALACCAAADPLEARVLRVGDGDSLRVEVDGKRIEVRVFGIDAPERGQPWGGRAKQALEQQVGGKRVALEAVEFDDYGRLVAKVTAGETCVACELVRGGHAWVYRRYTDDRLLIDLEAEARDAKRGLWGLPERERVAPWTWRRSR